MRSSRGRLLVFVDHEFQRENGRVTASDAFWIFIRGIGEAFSHTTYLGRVEPVPATGPYDCGPADRFSLVEMPYYSSLYALGKALPVIPRLLVQSWRAVGAADVVLVGVPHPIAVLVTAMARLRGKPRVLLDRQDLLPRVRLRSRGMTRALATLAARALVTVSALQSRRALTFTVGDHLFERYRRSGGAPQKLLISLVTEEHVRAGAPRTRPPGDERRLLWVGRIESDKGLDTLLNAFVELCRRSAPGPLVLDLVGTGAELEAVESRARLLGIHDRVRIHGYVAFGPRLEALYRRASVYVLPSNESEGFPQVILESFAAGLPLVSTAVAGIPGTLTDGREALLVPPRDPLALAAAIERVLTDDRLYRRLSRRGRDFAGEHTLEKQVGRFLGSLDRYLRNSETE